jgi:signal transduction histidine kinase
MKGTDTMSFLLKCIQSVAPYRLCLTGISAAVALPVGAGALFLRHKALQRERWVGYLGIAFLIFAVQYMVLMGFEFVRTPAAAIVESSNNFTAENWAGAIASNLNNLFFLAAARSLMRRRPSFPWWAFVLAVAGVMVDWGLGLHLIWSALRPFHRVADAAFSSIALGSVAYAMFANISPRRRAWLPVTALIGGGLYALLNIGYALVPPAVAGSLGTGIRRQLVGQMHLTESDLDTAFFAAAIPLKLILASVACALVLRTIVVLSPRALGMTLMHVSHENMDFFTGEGLLRLIAHSVRADRIAIFYRIPSLGKPRVAWWWFPYTPVSGDDSAITGGASAESGSGQMTRPVVRPLPAEESLEGRVLSSGLSFESPHIQRDREQGKLPAAAGNPGVEPAERGSVVMVPMFYNGFITGGVSLGWNTTYAFSPTTRQQAERLAEIVSIVAEARRRLAAVLTWGDAERRLDLQRTDGSRTVASNLAGRLYRIFAPLAAGIFLDVGFYRFWSVAGEEQHLSGAAAGGDWDAFWRAISQAAGPLFRGKPLPIPLRVHDLQIGEVVFAWPSPADQPQRPVVLCDPQLRQTIALLVTGAVLDLFDGLFSSFLTRLGVELSAPLIATPGDWLAAIEPTSKKAGLLWAVVVFGPGADAPLGRPLAVEAVERLLEERPGLRSSDPEVVALPASVDGAGTAVVISLPASGAWLWLGVARTGFGPELDVSWPWGSFLRRLGEAADLVLARITSREEVTRLRQESEQFKSLLSRSVNADLFLHELINIARNFESAAVSLADAKRFKLLVAPPKVDENIDALQESAGRLFHWIHSIEQSWSAEEACRLVEVIGDVRKMFDSDLKEHRIAFHLDVLAEPDPRVAVPFHVAHHVVFNLISNSIDAIGNDGRIDIEIRELAASVQCDVIDTGHGVDPGIREKIFTGHSTKKQGHGKGLSSLDRLLDGKGTVRLGSSIPFERTVFTLELPKPQEEGAHSEY